MTQPIVERPDTPPTVLFEIAPEFPARALEFNLSSGAVTLEFIVPSSGRICDILVVAEGGFGFNESAVDTIRLWRFAPALAEGKPVSARYRVEIKFQKLARVSHYLLRWEARFNRIVHALESDSEGERKRAFADLRDLSERKYAPADALYGIALLEGKGVRQNIPLGLNRIHRAKEKGAPLADFALGHALEFGLGFPPDRTAAFQHYRRAAEAALNPVPAAQLRLATAHLSGDIVTQDRSAAIHLFRKCAASGVKACAFNLALTLSKPEATETDRTEALAWALILEDTQHPRVEELLKTLDGPLRPTATALKPQLFPQRYKP